MRPVEGAESRQFVRCDDHVAQVVLVYRVVVDAEVEENRIREWAPYRQCVLIRHLEGFSFGDGCAVKNPKSRHDERVGKASTRILKNLHDTLGTSVDPDKITEVREGYRPYLRKGSPSFVVKHNDWLFSATGGAKNSTILCGHIALSLYSLLQR